MAAEWHRKWSRLKEMGWDELSTRAYQEISKRRDLALYRLGVNALVPVIPDRPTASSSFFFGPDGPRQRALLISSLLPHEAEKIVRYADNICRHQFDLLGYENLQYGAEIDWHLDPVHGKRGQLIPWFKIDFLDFGRTGDHKLIWELNRHQHLVTLAKAWLLTGNEGYAQEIVAQWYSWQKANPYPIGINWASSLEVAFRSLSWLWVLELAGECSEFTASFKNKLLSALRLNGRYIEKYLSTYFSPNTHLLGEAAALFFIGTLCPQIPNAEEWQIKGWNILLQESQRQVRSDGVYFEQALYYHVYALDFFLHARRLAEVNGISIPGRFDETLKMMLGVVHALSATGTLEGFGDDDGGRVFDPRRNQIEHLTDPLALGAVTYAARFYSSFGLTEEAIWLFGTKAADMLASSPARPAPGESKAFTSGGIYLMNDHNLNAQLMIDAGPQGTARSGHGHADALSVRFSLGGRRLLIDSGTGSYVPQAERSLFRGTGAHNTLRVDNLDQAVPSGPFAWDSIPQTTTESWISGQTFDFFSGTHDGYGRLPEPVLHRRTVFHLNGDLWLIHDAAEGRGQHLLELFWHFAPDVTITQEPGIVLINPSNDHKLLNPYGLAMLWDAQSEWRPEITQALVSPAYGQTHSAPVLRLSKHGRLPQESGILLIPHFTELCTFSATRGDNVSGYRYQAALGTDLFFFSSRGRWTCHHWSSDARFLYCKLEGNRLARIIMIDGSFIDWNERRLIAHSKHLASFEWPKSNAPTTDSSFPAADTTATLELDFFDETF